jgi:hypothetical protein
MAIALYFQFPYVWYCFMNHKHEALWLLKNGKLYILCTLILFNPPHLTVGSRLILTLNEF